METHLVVCAYIFWNDKVLLIHHNKLDKWLPVGGHIDPDETPDQALVREIKEETNLDVEILNRNDLPMEGNTKENLALPFFCNVHNVGDHDHSCLYYICKALNPEELKINDELRGAKWLSKEELDQDFVQKDIRNQGLNAFELISKLE